VVDGDRVLLLFHRKLQMWLPPGGHIEPNELPDEAAIREVLEETGVHAALIGETALPIDAPRQLVRPEGIQLETIGPGHEHIDLVYYAVPTGGAIAESVECDNAGWYPLAELEALGVNEEVRAWSARAVKVVAARLTGKALVVENSFS
jgi:ADP-ribose pyrophosphatase YjhB (NUDIX family)